jgi:acyl-CoA thioester hydrolase
MSEAFSIPLRVYYEDTDAGGVVYHANYLRYMERCRSEWLAHNGWPIDRVERECGMVFVVTQLEARFLAPAKLMDSLSVTTEFVEVRRVQFKSLQTVCRGAERLFEATVTLACLDRQTFRPVAIPQHLLLLFKKINRANKN